MSIPGAALKRFDEEAATVPALKLQAAERLAAHRARRAHASGPGLFEETTHSTETRAGRIAAAVAERYAHSQSYRAFLAEEAARAHAEAERARAAAEVARRTAEAVAAVQMQLLEELEEIAAEECAVEAEVLPVSKPVARPSSSACLTVRLYEVPAPGDLSCAVANAVPYAKLDEEERMALDEEIAFRQAPVFEDFQQAAVPLPANLIEFPRQLVAARKARPRLAEGPLRDEEERAGDNSQLRIFEVEPELISTVVAHEPTVPEWGSIRLDACQVTAPLSAPEYPVSYRHRPVIAAIELRAMATLVDGVVLLGAVLGFATATTYLSGQVSSLQVAGISVAVALVALAVLYYGLCFTLSDATPGMRYARIGLCTLDDENPSRAAIRSRLVAMLLAACPLGLGFLWAFVDDEGLGWHDRMSRMYPRSY